MRSMTRGRACSCPAKAAPCLPSTMPLAWSPSPATRVRRGAARTPRGCGSPAYRARGPGPSRICGRRFPRSPPRSPGRTGRRSAMAGQRRQVDLGAKLQALVGGPHADPGRRDVRVAHTVSVAFERVGGPGGRGGEVQLHIACLALRLQEGFEAGGAPEFVDAHRATNGGDGEVAEASHQHVGQLRGRSERWAETSTDLDHPGRRSPQGA